MVAEHLADQLLRDTLGFFFQTCDVWAHIPSSNISMKYKSHTQYMADK